MIIVFVLRLRAKPSVAQGYHRATSSSGVSRFGSRPECYTKDCRRNVSPMLYRGVRGRCPPYGVRQFVNCFVFVADASGGVGHVTLLGLQANQDPRRVLSACALDGMVRKVFTYLRFPLIHTIEAVSTRRYHRLDSDRKVPRNDDGGHHL